MKIAIMVPNFSGYSGDACVVKTQAMKLLREGHSVTIFSLDGELTVDGANIIKLGMPRNLLFQRIFRLLLPLNMVLTHRALSLLKEFDLIISHNYPMNWFAFMAKKRFNQKYTFWYHGIPNPDNYVKLYEKVYMSFFIKFSNATIRNADKLVSVSEYAQHELKTYSGLISEVVYNSPDHEIFHRGVDGSQLKKKLDLEKSIILLNVGRVCSLKGMHVLAEVIWLLRQKIPNIKLIIVGECMDPDYKEKIKNKLGNMVVFTGYVPHENIAEYYAMCDLYVTASSSETFDLPIVEAQECGKRVVAFDVGGHKEVTSINGSLVKNGDVEEFAAECLRALRSEGVLT